MVDALLQIPKRAELIHEFLIHKLIKTDNKRLLTPTRIHELAHQILMPPVQPEGATPLVTPTQEAVRAEAITTEDLITVGLRIQETPTALAQVEALAAEAILVIQAIPIKAETTTAALHRAHQAAARAEAATHQADQVAAVVVQEALTLAVAQEVRAAQADRVPEVADQAEAADRVEVEDLDVNL